ncbi:MAG: DoxX family protein [Saprospirales bacterium]|nr:MAG: DoxX family protein [Saprospirales bacterium]
MKLPDLSPKHAFTFLRALTGFIFVMHGLARIYYGTIPGFGGYLDSQGFMIGLQLAWLVTIGEIVCGSMLAFGYNVKYCAIFHAIVLITGMVLIHIRQGWFTVGQNTGGVEFSLLLLAVLLLLYAKDSKPGGSLG